MKLSAAAAAAMGTAAATGTAAAAASRHGISFDRVVNAVEDLGWDPNGDREISVPTDDGLLIEVPAGEYVFRGSGDKTGPVQGSLTNWGIRGLGDEPSDVVFRTSNGKSGRFINSRPSSDGLLVENLTFDNTDDRTGGDIGNALRAADNLEVHDVDHIGFSGREPYCRWSIMPFISTAGGVGNIVNYSKTGPSVFAGHGSSDGGGGVFNAHEGRLNFKDCTIANQGGDGGLYTGKHPGKIVFDGCHFENNDMAVIRTGAGSELRNCTILMDWDNAHPDNVIDHSDYPTGTNGVYFSSAQFGKSGGGIYDTDVIIKSTYKPGQAGITINNSEGNFEIHDTRVQVDVDNMPGIWCRDPGNQRLSAHKTPSKPWDIDIRNVSVTGSGDMDGKGAIVLDRRHGSTITDSCVQVDGNADGICIRNARNCTVQNTNINVGGRATVFGSSSVDTSGISQSDGCPLPSMGGSSDASDGSDDGDDSDSGASSPVDGSNDGEQSLLVEGIGEFTRYAFECSHELRPDPENPPESEINGKTAKGIVAGSNDGFLFDGAGEVTTFEFETGSANVYVNGERVAPEDVPEATRRDDGSSSDDGSSDDGDDSASDGDSSTPSEYELEVVGRGDYTRYQFSVTGGIVSLEDGEEAPNGASSVKGHLAGGVDPYRITGAVESFEFTRREADLRLDGEAVTPDELVEKTQQTTDDGSDDSDDSTGDSGGSDSGSGGSDGGDDSDDGDTGHGGTSDGPHELLILGNGDYARYRVEVSEGIYSKEDGEETPNGGSSVTGHVAGGKDLFEFTGEVTDFEFETGTATVYLDNERVDPQSLVDAEGLPENTVSIVGAPDEVASYRFTTDGSVVVNPDKGTFDAADNISEKSAEGAVTGGGVDSYRFSGSITDFSLTGTAAVYVNGTQVSPDLLGTGEDARLLDLIVVDGTGSSGRCDYRFSVDGHVAKSLELGTVEAEDTIEGGTVTGTVEGERDAYRFAGTLTGFDMDGSATLRFQSN
ncbi:hypothetical protein [Halomarina oriensis]|uniref:Right handed beta helix domain-containing protein n=1 Tax=Halomarina oriensis TaxID=671145 RepID=A0A6B0GHG1_9EURY|nr:hypothetical protein [Halomarina oriensis]MWG33211.1 hypothetical protein [Halomarina oriensis]